MSFINQKESEWLSILMTFNFNWMKVNSSLFMRLVEINKKYKGRILANYETFNFRFFVDGQTFIVSLPIIRLVGINIKNEEMEKIEKEIEKIFEKMKIDYIKLNSYKIENFRVIDYINWKVLIYNLKENKYSHLEPSEAYEHLKETIGKLIKN